MLQIYNTLTRRKELFQPVNPPHVGIYLCGMTVYDYCHIGHARSWVFFDVMVRYLRTLGYDVTYVRNVTDIDDKIIKRANEQKISCDTVTHKFIEAMHEDERALFINAPDKEPKATEYIAQMIRLIQQLLEKGFAYSAGNGDICFRIREFTKYGQLSGRDLEGLMAGARVEVEDAKADPLDFVLWKMAKPGEPAWESPWGAGRPGWHTECVAMSSELLGEKFDIHGGGLDLQFPHHENEIAQAQANGSDFAKIWMHVGLVQVNREKMSKSLNNFITIREILKDYQPEIARYFLISSHYRSPINYSHEALQNANVALQRFYIALRELPASNPLANSEYEKRFVEAMNDDFNTPVALSVLFELTHQINTLKDSDVLAAAQHAALLKKLGEILGILQQDPEVFLQAGIDEKRTAEIQQLIDARIAARTNKNWAEADRIRDQLQTLGVVLEDSTDGTRWRLS